MTATTQGRRAEVVAWQLMDAAGNPVGVRCAVTGLVIYKGIHSTSIPLVPADTLAEMQTKCVALEQMAAMHESNWLKAEEVSIDRRNKLSDMRRMLEGLADALIERAAQHAVSSEMCSDPINAGWHNGMAEGIDDCANELRAILGGDGKEGSHG